MPRVGDRRGSNGILRVLRKGRAVAGTADGVRVGTQPGTTRFVRWRKAGVWERVPVVVTEAYEGEVQMIDVGGAISASVNAMRAPITVPAFFFRLPFQLIKPSALPTLANAASARSSWSAEWAADNWTRMRACPRGTTGNEKPTT